MFLARLLSFLCLSCLAASVGVAKQHAAMSVAVEIIPPTLTLSVSSARLDFGQIGQNAGPVELHPESGERSGEAYGAHRLAGLLLTGSPGTQVTVEVLPPFSAPRSATQPYFRHSWARSHECTQAAFERLPDTTTLQDKIGESGCTQIRVGGTLFANQAPQGRYVGEMTVQITQL